MTYGDRIIFVYKLPLQLEMLRLAFEGPGLELQTYALLCDMRFTSTVVCKSSAKDNKPIHNDSH